jgi:hypothetical protein
VDDNGVVNAGDLLRIAVLYGLRIGMSNFNPRADLNLDSTINVADLGIAATQYARQCRQ